MILMQQIPEFSCHEIINGLKSKCIHVYIRFKKAQGNLFHY